VRVRVAFAMNTVPTGMLLERMFLARRVVICAAAIFVGFLYVGSSPFHAGLWMFRGEPLVLIPPLSLALLGILGGSPITCYYVFRIGLRGLGLKYAIGHLLLCVALSFMVLVGIMVVPLLVRYDLERSGQFEGESPDDGVGKRRPVPSTDLRHQFRYHLRWILPLATALGLSYVISYGLVIWHLNRPIGGHVTVLNAFSIELPPGSRLRFGQGFDSYCGAFILPGGRELQFNIEHRPWISHTDYSNGPFEWRKHEEHNGLRMEYSLTSLRGTRILCAGFPQLGAGLRCELNDKRDLDEMMRLIRTVQWPSP